jgi:hypothetical protein
MTSSRSQLGGVVLAAALLLTACGNEGDTAAGPDTAQDSSSADSPSSDPTDGTSTDPSTDPTETEPTDDGEVPEPTSPACSEIWVAGQAFPARYRGCFDEDSSRWVQAMVYRCSSGQQLVTYRRTFYAAKGEQVNETDVPLARDPAFQKALASCGA